MCVFTGRGGGRRKRKRKSEAEVRMEVADDHLAGAETLLAPGDPGRAARWKAVCGGSTTKLSRPAPARRPSAQPTSLSRRSRHSSLTGPLSSASATRARQAREERDAQHKRNLLRQLHFTPTALLPATHSCWFTPATPTSSWLACLMLQSRLLLPVSFFATSTYVAKQPASAPP